MKTMMMLGGLLTAFTLFAQEAPQNQGRRSGDIVGNGGHVDVKVMPDGTMKGEVVEVFEARYLLKLPISLPLTTEEMDELKQRAVRENRLLEELIVEAKVLIGVKRLARLDPIRAERLKEMALSFFPESNISDEVDLPDLEDLGPTLKPKGTKRYTAIIQNHPILAFGKYYFVEESLWNSLDLDNKACLVLHEITLREWLREKPKNENYTSDKARELNVNLFTALIDNLKTRAELLKFYQKINLVDFAEGSSVISVPSVTFYENGRIHSYKMQQDRSTFTITLHDNEQSSVRSKMITGTPSVTTYYANGQIEEVTDGYGNSKRFNEAGVLIFSSKRDSHLSEFRHFYDDGSLATLSQGVTPYWFSSSEVETKPFTPYFCDEKIQVSELNTYGPGRLYQVVLDNRHRNTLICWGNNKVEAKGNVLFHPNGMLSRFTLAKPTYLNYQGRALLFQGEVLLNDKGEFTDLELSPEASLSNLDPQAGTPYNLVLGFNARKDLLFWPNGKLQHLASIAHSPGNNWVHVLGQKLDVADHEGITFHENGILAKAGISLSGALKRNKILVAGKKITISEINLWERGTLKSFVPYGGYEEVELKVGDNTVDFLADARLSFYPNGKIKSGTLNEWERLTEVGGDCSLYTSGTYLEFNEKGEVLVP